MHKEKKSQMPRDSIIYMFKIKKHALVQTDYLKYLLSKSIDIC